MFTPILLTQKLNKLNLFDRLISTKDYRKPRLVGHIKETMPNGLLKLLKPLLQSIPARYIKF